jgi:opacity protein-like surface antigen
MNKVALRAMALVAGSWIVSAQAADLPYYGPRGPYTVNQPLNAYSWAGPYLGGNLGWAWGTIDNSPTKPSGLEGGIQGGYNWQSGALVFGAEFGIAPNWSAKVEYLYIDLADDRFSITGTTNGSQFGVLRAGVNYHF